MPRVYLFTIFISMIIGASIEKIVTRSYASHRLVINPEEMVIIILLIILYVNEKTALLENALSSRTRRKVGRLQ